MTIQLLAPMPTGVFASQEEMRSIATAPKQPFAKNNGALIKSAQEVAHDFARAHGLPEVRGYYGITAEGEFVRPIG